MKTRRCHTRHSCRRIVRIFWTWSRSRSLHCRSVLTNPSNQANSPSAIWTIERVHRIISELVDAHLELDNAIARELSYEDYLVAGMAMEVDKTQNRSKVGLDAQWKHFHEVHPCHQNANFCWLELAAETLQFGISLNLFMVSNGFPPHLQRTT